MQTEAESLKIFSNLSMPNTSGLGLRVFTRCQRNSCRYETRGAEWQAARLRKKAVWIISEDTGLFPSQ